MVRREIDLALDGSSTEYELSFRFIKPDGVTIWLADQAKIDRDASGAPLRMRGMIRDISGQKVVEQELARYPRSSGGAGPQAHR
jgi:PAS domain S-box-containing protein